MHPDNNRQNALPTIFFKVFFKVLICNLRTPSDGFAEQNGRDAERAD